MDFIPQRCGQKYGRSIIRRKFLGWMLAKHLSATRIIDYIKFR